MHLKERCNAAIAVAQGDLFIRTHKHLWCVGEGNKQPWRRELIGPHST